MYTIIIYPSIQKKNKKETIQLRYVYLLHVCKDKIKDNVN